VNHSPLDELSATVSSDSMVLNKSCIINIIILFSMSSIQDTVAYGLY